MRFELQLFVLLIGLGLTVKKLDWRGQFFLFLFICLWIFYNWKKG
jgi:maltose O-acetyltransferase